jgi:hypothetical protein
VSVDAEELRGSSEADPLKMLKQPMDVVGASVLRSAHRRTNTHDPSSLCAPTQLLLCDFRLFRIAFHVKRALAAAGQTEAAGAAEGSA